MAVQIIKYFDNIISWNATWEKCAWEDLFQQSWRILRSLNLLLWQNIFMLNKLPSLPQNEEEPRPISLLPVFQRSVKKMYWESNQIQILKRANIAIASININNKDKTSPNKLVRDLEILNLLAHFLWPHEGMWLDWTTVKSWKYKTGQILLWVIEYESRGLKSLKLLKYY